MWLGTCAGGFCFFSKQVHPCFGKNQIASLTLARAAWYFFFYPNPCSVVFFFLSPLDNLKHKWLNLMQNFHEKVFSVLWDPNAPKSSIFGDKMSGALKLSAHCACLWLIRRARVDCGVCAMLSKWESGTARIVLSVTIILHFILVHVLKRPSQSSLELVKHQGKIIK